MTNVIPPPDPAPQVPLPLAAVPSNDPAEWSMWDNKFRVIYGRERTVATHWDNKITVETSAVQRADGSIEELDVASHHSGPSVSVQSHGDDYLTADQARQLAGLILEAAAEADRWGRTARSAHGCPFPWCDTPDWKTTSDGEHYWLVYHPASLRHCDPHHLTGEHVPAKVGIGVNYDEGDRPSIVIHFDGGEFDYDEDVFLRIDEAAAIRDALSAAVVDATEALQHAYTHEIGSS